MSQAPENSQANLASLYVGDLKPEVTEQSLWNVFAPYGQVVSVRICRDAQTQSSLRYAYVNYRNAAEAEKAIKYVNFASIDGRPCRVMWSMRDSNRRKLGIGNLFVKNIHPDVDSRSLYDAFSHFGPILSCKVACDEYGISKGYGFVQFYAEKDAETARIKSDGTHFRNKALVVTNFLPKSKRPNARIIDPNEFTNVFVKNLPNVTSIDDMKNMFSKFGEITSCYLHSEVTENGTRFGFINFASPSSAKDAVEQMNDSELLNGTKLFVSRAQRKLEREAYLKRLHEERKKEFYKQFQDKNLYVKNFDDSVNDDKLREMFAPFGRILNAQVMKDDTGKSKGFGFVCFGAAEDAKVAMETMNSKMIDNKPLFVCLAQNKEDRKKMIEQRAYSTGFRPAFVQPGGVHFMYPPPAGAIPYPTQFPGYPARMPSVRPTTRPQQPMQNPQPAQNFQQQGQTRQGNYGQNQHQYHPGGMRSRGGSQRYHHANQMGNYTQRVPATNPPAAVGVNAVGTEGQTRPKREERQQQQQQPKTVTDPQTTFKNDVFQLVQTTFRERNYPMNMVSSIAGVVIDYYTNNSKLSYDKDEIIHTILSAYSEMTKSSTGSDSTVQL